MYVQLNKTQSSIEKRVKVDLRRHSKRRKMSKQ